MTQLFDFEVGPYCGHVTSHSIRVWGAAQKMHISVPSKGIVRWKNVEDEDFQINDVKIFGLKTNLDGTGIVDIQGLDPNTQYIFQAHYYMSGSPDDVEWVEERLQSCSGKTVPTNPDEASSSFVLASCRDHGDLKNGGLSDKAFRMMYNTIANKVIDLPDFMMLGGDQIYADMGHGYKYQEIYRHQFSETHFSLIRSMIPTYMQMDDHEVDNDWARNTLNDEELLEKALLYFKAYQASLATVYPSASDYGQSIEDYSYKFERHDSRYFVMDVRYDRYVLDKDASYKNYEWLLKSKDGSEKQIDDLVAWINDATDDKIHFIMTAVPMFPDTRVTANPILHISSKHSIKELWTSNTEQRKRILGAISNSNANFVFLSGDVHCSFTAKLQLPNERNIYSIVSSALNWMIPGLNKSCFDRKKLKGLDGSRGNIKILNNEHFETRNNFTLIKVNDPSSIAVSIYDGHNGDKINGVILDEFKIGMS